MEEKVLAAQELLRCHQNRQQFSLPSFGDKCSSPSGSAQESRQLENRLESLQNALQNPRISQRSQLTKAVWDLEKHEALVTKPCGKHWDVMGHARDDQLFLNAEEALFLLESNALEILLHDIPMSIQQSYEVMLGDDCSLNEYRAYSHLMRQGTTYNSVLFHVQIIFPLS